MADMENTSDVESKVAADFAASMEDIAAGRTVDFDSVLARLDERIRRVQDARRGVQASANRRR